MMIRRYLLPIISLLFLAGWMAAAMLCDVGIQLRDEYQHALRESQNATDQEYASRKHIEFLEGVLEAAQLTWGEHVRYYFLNNVPDGHRRYNPWPIAEPAPNPSCTYCQNMATGTECTAYELGEARLAWLEWDWLITYWSDMGLYFWQHMGAHAANCEECES